MVYKVQNLKELRDWPVCEIGRQEDSVLVIRVLSPT